MPVERSGASVENWSVGNSTLSVTSCTVGHLMVVNVSAAGTTAPAVTFPVGWTVLYTQTQQVLSTRFQCVTAYKFKVNETAVLISMAANAVSAVDGVYYGGVDTTNPIRNSGSLVNDTTSPVVISGVTGGKYGDRAICFYYTAQRSGTTPTSISQWTGTPSWTEVKDAGYDENNICPAIAMAESTNYFTADTDTGSATLTASQTSTFGYGAQYILQSAFVPFKGWMPSNRQNM